MSQGITVISISGNIHKTYLISRCSTECVKVSPYEPVSGLCHLKNVIGRELGLVRGLQQLG